MHKYWLNRRNYKGKKNTSLMHKFFIMNFCLLLIFSGVSAVSATTYYVSPTGNNNDNGMSLGAAWATIQHAANAMVPGDTVRVQAGTYNEQVSITKSGTSTGRIIYIGDGSPTVNGATKGFELSGASYITISGFNVTASNYGIYANTGNYLNILNNEVRQTSSSGTGIELANSNYAIIDNNVVMVRSYGIVLDWSFANHDNTITNNYVDSLSVDEQGVNGIDAGRNPAKSSNQNISYNTVVGSGHNGINLAVSNSYIGYNTVGDSSNRISHNCYDLHGIQNSTLEYNIARDSCGYNSGYYIEGTTYPTFNVVFRHNKAISITGGRGAFWSGNKDSYILDFIATSSLSSSQSQGLLIMDELARGRSSNVTLENVILSDSDYPLAFDSPLQDDYYIINSQISKKTGGYSDILFDKTFGQPSMTAHMINSNTEEVKWYSGTTGGEILFYYYLDMKVVDSSGNPIPGAKVSFVNLNDSNYPAKNLRVPDDSTQAYVPPGSITYTYTRPNGHTPLPAEDRFGTVAIPDYLKTSSSTSYYTFKITAEYNGVINSTIVNPDSSWYRSDPNTYQNTVTIVLPTTINTGNVTGTVTNQTDGAPISGATVTDGVKPTTTDALGNFFLANINNGSRNITASKTGYQAATKSVTVVENSTVTADFQLSPLILPTITSYSPSNLTPSQDEGTTNTFNVTVDQPVTNKWFLDSVQQAETSQSYTRTWSYTDAGTHNITYSGENSNGTVTKTWNVTVIDSTDAAPPTITLTSPESKEYTTNIIPLTYYANEPISNCIVTVDSTANQFLTACENLSVISREYASASNTAAWWHFNESLGNLVMDSSGNANTGTISGASWTAGKFGSALRFNGSTSFVEVPDSDVLDGGSQITIEAWVKPVLGTRGTVVAKYTYNSSIPVNDRVYELDIDTDGKVKFALSSNGTGSGVVWLASSNAVINNAWNHIVATSNGTSMKIYINGVLDPNTKSAPSAIHSSPYNLQIGAWRYDAIGAMDTYFNGLIDEVRILKKALTEEELKADHALGAGSHNVTVYAVDLSGNWNSTTRYFTILDTTPPLSITSLQNTSYAQNYINWAWTDPADSDFSKIMVYLNNIYQTNVTKGVQFYNATGLSPDTSYTISTHTVDTSGNINQTWINYTAKTAPTTPLQGDNTVSIADNITASPGTNTTVPVMIYSAIGIGSVGINLTYNASVVNVTSASQGNFTDFFAFDNSNASKGWVTINTYIRETQLTGDITIASVTFEATGSPGDASPLNLKVLAIANQTGVDMPYSTDNGTFAVASPSYPPVLESIGDRTVDEGQYLGFTLSATDPDGDALTY